MDRGGFLDPDLLYIQELAAFVHLTISQFTSTLILHHSLMHLLAHNFLSTYYVLCIGPTVDNRGWSRVHGWKQWGPVHGVPPLTENSTTPACEGTKKADVLPHAIHAGWVMFWGL